MTAASRRPGTPGTVLWLGALSLVASVLLAGQAVLVADSRIRAGPIYSVGGVQAGLAHHPETWLGRTVQVRGIAETCLAYGTTYGTCLPLPQPRLVDADPAARVAPLLLAREPANPGLAVLRRVPLLGALAPAPQVLQWGVGATYRVRLPTAPDTRCGAPPCYQALVLDAAP